MKNFFAAWAGKLRAPYQATVLLSRIRSSEPLQLLTAAAPTYINNLLYLGVESAKVIPHRLPVPVSIKCFSTRHPSGVDRIDKSLTPHRLVYAVFCGGEIVHQSWVRFDALTPSQYGFDSRVPVIGEAFTQRIYRGYGVFPFTMNCILKDLKKRHGTDQVYALVSPTNNASVRGLEKAGFQLLAHLKGTRLLGIFIMNKSIERAPEALALPALPIAS